MLRTRNAGNCSSSPGRAGVTPCDHFGILEKTENNPDNFRAAAMSNLAQTMLSDYISCWYKEQFVHGYTCPFQRQCVAQTAAPETKLPVAMNKVGGKDEAPFP